MRNLRGAVLPVIGLAELLGAARAGAPSRLLVVEEELQGVAGLAIDEVLDVERVEGVAEPAESALLTSHVLTEQGELVGLLDVRRVLEAVTSGPPP